MEHEWPFPGRGRYQKTSLPMGLTTKALETYLVAHGASWVVDLRQLILSFDPSALNWKPLPAGRPAYHPLALLGLVLYGKRLRLQSSRELERLALFDLGAWYMTHGARPDHTTLATFLNRQAEALHAPFF
jgi:hypothetical protein